MTKARFLFYLLFCFAYFGCGEQQSPISKATHENSYSIGTTKTIYSKVMEEEREIFIHVPSGFYGMDEQETDYPVLYVMDGESQFLSTTGIADQLSSPYSANDMIPQMIVVGIPNTNRTRDLSPSPAVIGTDSTTLEYTGGAGLMAEFMQKELIPYIDSTYSTSSHRVLIGHSLGGLFVLNTLVNHPDLFQNYLAIDPALDWDDFKFANGLVEDLKDIENSKIRLYIATANNRMSWMKNEDVKTDTSSVMRMMRGALLFKDKMQNVPLNIKYQNEFYEDEDHYQLPIVATYDAFKYFYDYHPFSEIKEYYSPREDKGELMTEIKVHFENVSEEMGYDVVPMESYINSWAFGYNDFFERPDIAEKLIDYNIDNYPNSPIVYGSKGYVLLSQGDTSSAIELFEKSVQIEEVDYIKATLNDLKEAIDE